MLLYAFGWYTPIFRLMFDVLPGVDLFRRPADATFIIGFLIAVIGGYLVHRVVSGTAPRPHFAAAIAAGMIAALVPVAFAIAYAVNRTGVAVKPVAVGLAFAVAAIAVLELARRLVPTRPLIASFASSLS